MAITALYAEVAAGTVSNREVDEAGTIILELALTPGVKYFHYWYLNYGSDTADEESEAQVTINGTSQIDATATDTLDGGIADRTFGRARGPVAGEEYNAGILQGFFVGTAGGSGVMKMVVGSPAGSGFSNDAPHGVGIMFALPLTTLVEGTDYFEEATMPQSHFTRSQNDVFPSEIDGAFSGTQWDTKTFSLPDAGDYLCFWASNTIGDGAASPTSDGARTNWAPALDAGATTEETPPMVGAVPDGDSGGFLTTGFRPVHDHTQSDSWLFTRFGQSWISLETLALGNHDFGMYGGVSTGTSFVGYAHRVFVLRAKSFPGGITQARKTARQQFTSATYADVTSMSVTIAPTTGQHVVFQAVAARVDSDDSVLQTRIQNATSAATYGDDASQNAWGGSSAVSTFPLCPVAVEDVTGDGETTWKIQARRDAGSSTGAYVSGDISTGDVDSNLIVLALGDVQGTVTTDSIVAPPTVTTQTIVHPLLQTAIASTLVVPSPDAFEFPGIPVGIITSNTSDAGVLAIKAHLESRGPSTGEARTVTLYDETSVTQSNFEANAVLLFLKNLEAEAADLKILLDGSPRPALFGYSAQAGGDGSILGLAGLMGVIRQSSQYASVDDPTIALATTHTAFPPTDAFAKNETLNLFEAAETVQALSSSAVAHAGSSLLIDGSSRPIMLAIDQGAAVTVPLTGTFARRVVWAGWLSATAGLGTDGAAMLSASVDWLARFHDNSASYPT